MPDALENPYIRNNHPTHNQQTHDQNTNGSALNGFDTTRPQMEAFAGSVSDFTEPSAVAPTLPSHGSALWEQILESVPMGVAVLDALNGQAVWTNAALRRLLQAGVGMSDVLHWQPHEFLPDLESADWDAILERFQAVRTEETHPEIHSESGRLQFVHHATRNIAYWEWTAQTLAGPGSDNAYLLLTVQNVSDVVMNERQLATAVRTSHQARRDSEALGNMTQLVNQSLTTPDLLRAIVHEAADYFDTPHAAVLLLAEAGPREGHQEELQQGQHFKVGYSIGLKTNSEAMRHATSESQNAARLPCANTLAGKAIAQRETLVETTPNLHSMQTLLLANGRKPDTVVCSPIRQNDHIYGVVEIYFDETHEIREDSVALLAAFADQTAIGLLKADLYEQIATQRSQLQSIFDNAPVGILYFDADGIAVTANAAAATSYGDTLENIIGHPGADLLPDLPPRVFEMALAGKPFHASHVVFARTPGHEVIYDVSLVPVTSDSGISGLLLLTFEVTELVTSRQEADAARKEAEDALAAVRATQSQMVQMEKMRAVGELAQGVAHDINNALMAVLGYTELAEDDLDDPAALTGHLQTIKKAAMDASSTVQRLNRFAKRGIATHGDHTDLNEVIKDVVHMTRPKWRDAAHKEGRQYIVETELQAIPPILGEPSGLREVLINMIHNALNAMPNGGILILSTRPHGDKYVEIEVADTGAGMTPEVMSRIFDPFFTTRGVEGTGLGLAVSWSIIQRHGGTIEVASAPGEGTHFFIRLPISLAERTDMPPVLPLAPPPPAPGTPVLVVDDEPIVSSVLSSILGRHGYRVTVANDAQEALELLRTPNANFQLVMTDHGMPGMNGLQLIAEIKRVNPKMPVLLLTGWGENVMKTHVAEALPDAVLGKPINQSDLLEALSKLMSQHT